MPAVQFADRVVVSVTATESGDWQVVSTPTGFQGITSANFEENEYLGGFVIFEDGENWEVYDGEEDANFLEISSITGTVTLARPADDDIFASTNNGNRVSAGAGTHTFSLTPGAATIARIWRETNPSWKTFTSGDATPSVADFRHFKTNGTTTITAFDDMSAGQLFRVYRNGDDITIQNSASIVLPGGADLTLTTDEPCAVFVEDGGVAKWVGGGLSKQSLKTITNVLAASELTISSGAVTPTRASHSIDTESDASSDDLDTITATNFQAGDILTLAAVHTDRTVVLKHGTGNIVHPDGLDISLDDTVGTVQLRYDGTNWNVLSSGAPVIDEDNFASDSAVRPPSQQSTAAYIATQIATVTNKVATIAAMTGIGVAALSAGYTLNVGEADRGGTFVLTDAAYTGDEGVLLAPDTPVGNLHWRRVYDGAVHTKWFGLTTDGVTDVTDDFDAILQTYSANLYIDAGDYYCEADSLLALDNIGLQIPSNSRIEWDKDAWFIHEAGTDTNHFFAGLSSSNITLINPQIDGQEATTNLIGFGSPTRVSVIGGTLKNVRKARNPLTASTVVGGGQGITMQGFPKYCKIAFVHFEDCAVGIDAAGSETNVSVGNVITSCSFDDCETLVGSADAGYSVFDGDEDDDDYKNASWIITNLNFHNCGRSHGEINFEFTRRNSTSSTEYPFQCPAMANTSYGDANDDGTVDEAGYNWEITDYSTTDLALTGGRTAWTDGTSYDAADVVAINDDGKQSALFVGLNANHFIVNGVGGYNDDGYGHIGAIVWGTFASSRFVNIDVNVETDYLFRLGGCPAHMFNLVRHFQKSKFIHFGITNSGSTTYAYRIDGPTGTGVNFGTEGLSFDLAFRETNHTSLTHANNDGAFATNGFAGSTKARFQNLETQEVLEGRLDFIGNGSLEWSSFTDGVRTLHSGSLEIHSHSSNAQIKLVRTGTNTADIDIYAIADRLQIDGGDLGVSGTLGIGATPPNDKAMQVSYNDGVAAGDHAVLKFERSTGNFRGITFGYLANGTSDTDGYMAANGSQNLVIGHNNNVGGANPTLFLDGANDRVGIGNRAPNQALDVYGAIVWEPGASVTPTRNGEVTVEFTAFDTLTFKGRSGGVVRSATLTLST